MIPIYPSGVGWRTSPANIVGSTGRDTFRLRDSMLTIPEKYTEITIRAYTNGLEVVICEQRTTDDVGIWPVSEDDPRWNEETGHNCDANGCGTFSHVMARFPIDQSNSCTLDSQVSA